MKVKNNLPKAAPHELLPWNYFVLAKEFKHFEIRFGMHRWPWLYTAGNSTWWALKKVKFIGLLCCFRITKAKVTQCKAASNLLRGTLLHGRILCFILDILIKAKEK